MGFRISFTDVTEVKRLHGELLCFNQELETAYEEVQSTNEELQTTNEELPSTVEELETTNEELQSTNEELETMNEELHSANEELETMNTQLNMRSGDLTRTNDFLESVLEGITDGVIVLNLELHVLAWNRRSEDLWGLRADEASGKHIFNLNIGLPVKQLRSQIKACLSDGARHEISLDVVNRSGRAVTCRNILTQCQ